MIILPAIDILGGSCVRLVRGEYGSAGKVAADPIETALSFEADGAEFIHMVDLDGARDGTTVNAALFRQIAKAVNVPLELGGGIRTLDTVERYLDAGITRCILGSAALRQPEFVREAVLRYGEQIAVGIDAKKGKVSVSGWLETSDVGYIEFAELMADSGVSNIIFTDIDRDGTQTGANYEQLAALSEAVAIKITASGGIRDMDDIKRLCGMGLYGAIAGKSIYAGTLSLREAVEYTKGL